MANLAKYIVQLEAQTAKYKRGLDAAQRKLGRFQRKQSKSVKALNKAWAKFGASIVTAVSGAQFLRAARDSLKFADQLSKLVDRLGGTTEQWSRLNFVAERSGLAFNTLSIGLQRMQRRLSEASVDMGEARAALKELGVDARAVTNLPIEQQFLLIADALSKVDGASRRTALAMKIFDSEGVALLQTMKGGAAGIQSLLDKADSLGITLRTDAAAAAVQANNAITDLTTSWQAFTQHLATEAAPWLTKTAENLRRLTGGFSDEENLAKFEKQLDSLLASGLGLDSSAVQMTIDSINMYLKKIDEAKEALRDPFPGLQEIAVDNQALDDRREKTISMINNAAKMTAAYEAFLEKYRTGQKIIKANEVFKTASLDLELYIERQGSATEALETFAKASAELDEFFASGGIEAAKLAKTADQLGLTFSSMFEDAVLEGEKFSDVLRGILKDIARLALRNLFTLPAADAISGFLSGKAAGGPVSGGKPYVVGERGPEVFVPGASGTIIPNHRMGGGVAYAPTINISGDPGIDALALIPILEENNRKMKAELLNELDRGAYR